METIATPLQDIDWKPQSTADEVLQNVRCVISTVLGSVPLDREFGVSSAWLDDAGPVAEMKLRILLIDAIERFEPRAKIKSITFVDGGSDGLQGRLSPVVKLEIAE